MLEIGGRIGYNNVTAGRTVAISCPLRKPLDSQTDKVVGIMSINSPEQTSFAAARRVDRPKTYTIGDLAREFGVTLRTLRFYEDRGLLSPRREGTARIYDARDRARLSVILKGKQLGFTLTEIRAMVAEERGSEVPAANLKLSLAQVEDQIAHLEQQRTEIEQALEELRAHRDTLVSAAA
jgi:DNA-binding transcriptional MerR regulator